jgi:ABC-type polysaccharide/polyol phosphate export permease
MGVYTLVFSVYFRINIPNYPVFLLSGLLPWLWFSSSIQQGTGSIVDGSTFIGRTLLPSEILPVASILTNMMNFIFSLPLLLIFLTLFRVDLGWSLLTLPVIMLPQLLLSLGLVFLIATYNVFFRDLQYLITHLLTLLFFTVPIIYPLSYIPDRIRPIVEWNPLTVLAQSYQGIFFHNYFPDWWRLGYVTLLALAICWLGQRAFDRHKDAFAEYI